MVALACLFAFTQISLARLDHRGEDRLEAMNALVSQ